MPFVICYERSLAIEDKIVVEDQLLEPAEEKFSEPVFFTEIDDETAEVVTEKATEWEEITAELTYLQRSLEEKDVIEDDLTVDSIQNNNSASILIDDIMRVDEG